MRNTLLCACATGALAIALPSTAAAQDATTLGELVVTAQKREQRLQDVPLAVSAVTAQMLGEAQIDGTADLTEIVPSLTLTQGNNVSNTNLRIRGVGTATFNQGLESSVAVVLDGVGLARQLQGFNDLADIERVEVLRGPQGTLFGKNATAGAISVVTKRPSRTFEAFADATIAEGEEYRLKGSVSGPLGEQFAARLSGFHNDVGGHIRNVARGDDVNGLYGYGVRGKLEWRPDDDLTFLLAGEYRWMDSDCCQAQYIQVTQPQLAALLAPVVASRRNRDVNINARSFNQTTQRSVSLQGDWQLSGAAVTSMTAYQEFRFDNNVDVDGLNNPQPIFVPFTNGQFDVNGGPTNVNQFTQELRIASSGEQRLNYVAGLYYLDADVERGFRRRTGNCVANAVNGPNVTGRACAAPTYASGGHAATNGTRNLAAFGQADFAFTDQIVGIAGARLQREKVSYSGTRTGTPLVAGDTALFGRAVGAGSTSETDLSGKLGLQYRFSRQAQAYVSWTRGYKGAGYDIEVTANFASLAPVEPETVKAWELGYKAELWDGRASLNAAAFRAEYSNLQVQANQRDPVTGANQFVPTNAGASISKGVEIDLVVRPVSGLTLRGGVTWLDATFDIDGLNCPLPFQAAAPVVTGAAPLNSCFRTAAGGTPMQNLRDATLPNAPRWRGNVSARYERDIAGADLRAFAQVSVMAQSRIYFTLEQDPEATQPAYGIVDLSVGLATQDGRYRVTAFMKNLTDRNFLTSIGRSSQLTNAANPGNLTGFHPKEADRYGGLTLSAAF